MEVTAELLAAVKNYVDFTWAETEGDLKLTGIIKRGMGFLNRKAGATLDYAIEDMPREMLLEYCKYTRNGILHEFMANYSPFLQDLRSANGGAYGQAADV